VTDALVRIHWVETTAFIKCLIKLVGVYEWDSRSYTVGFSPTEGVYTDAP